MLKMSLGHLDQKIRTYSKKKKRTRMYRSNTGANCKSSKWPKLQYFEQQNKMILDYNPKYKIPMNPF